MLPQQRIIVPLDVSDFSSAIALVDKLPEVTFWKVGLELFLAAGNPILDYLKQQQKRIFLDLKFHDIPNTMAGASRSAINNYEVDFLTLHAAAGKQALQAAVAAQQEMTATTQLLAVTLLTSINAHSLEQELNVPMALSDYVFQMGRLAHQAGLNGAVCSPQEARQLKQVCGDNFLLVCPGVRPNFAQTQDQQRVMTPQQAFKAGADYLVIGRPITAAQNPVQAWQTLCEELETS